MILLGKVDVYDPAIRVAAVLGLLLVVIALLTGAQLLPGHADKHGSVPIEDSSSDTDQIEYERVL